MTESTPSPHLPAVFEPPPASAPVARGPVLNFAPVEPGGGAPGIPLSHCLWILSRHRWKILAFLGAAVLGTLIISMRVIPVYESTATVDIDRQSPPGIIGQEAMRSVLNDADQFLATQMKLIQSDSVLRPVLHRFPSIERPGGAAADPPPAAVEDAPVALRKLKVTRPPNTYLLQISYRSTDPRLAAEVANAVAQSYIEHTYNLRFRASSSLSAFMEKQLEELKAKMERSTAALAQFERELSVINPEEKTSILSARLLQLNAEYTQAQADRVRKQAAAQSLSNGTLEAAQVSAQGETLRKLAEHLNEAQEHFAQVRSQYGANHPEYRKAAAQLSKVEQQLEETRLNIAERVAVEYREALNREEILRQAVAETKAEFDRLNARSFEYQQLKREAEADKKIYDELVRRIKEAGINASFQSSQIRLADLARPGLKPVFPNVPLNVLLAFLFSTLVAVGAAVLSDALDNTVRDPDEVARSLRTTVIGSLPSVKGWRKSLAPAPVVGYGLALAAGPGGVGQSLSNFTESVRTLRNSILLADFDRQVHSLLITSASPSEGKSTTAAYLAVAHAEQGRRTLLIDGDMRRPSVHRRFGVSGHTGLSNVLLGETPWRAARIRPEGYGELDILPAGPSSRRAADLIGPNLADLMDEAAREYDLVLLDAPPLLGFAEPLQMATVVDGVVIVARAGATNRKAVATVIAMLQRLRANLLGLVLNEVKKEMSDSYYYYGHYGKYYGTKRRQTEAS